MRVLCLHPSTSSAHQLHSSLSSLEDRLWTKHGIELVFIDAPLLDVQIGDSLGEKGGGLTALHLDGEEEGNEEEGAPTVSRRWYVEEAVDGRRSALPPSSDDSAGTSQEVNNSNNSTAVKYSGLDASLLHLSQIWSRGGANTNNTNADNNNGGGIEQCLPFQGILGVHQGADVAAMLPLLNTANALYNDEDVEEEEQKENKSIFEGLQFVILVDGRDIMCQDQHEENMGNDGSVHEMNNEKNDNATLVEQEDWYVGPNGISSLHVIAETSNNDNNAASATNKRNSELLAKRYGPNATIQYYKPSKKSSSSQSNNNNSQHQQAYNHNQTTSPSLHNILGKYLVHQKNTFHSNPQKRKLLQLQHQLCHVEQLASVMITEEVRKDPPKCLMAMIGPAAASEKEENTEDENDENNKNSTDDENSAVKAVVPKTVGAWQGPGRVPGEQGGGAPCPETFLLRQEERGNNVVAPHDIILADEK